MPDELRTIHGGADSALCIEVQAWRRDGDSIVPCLGYIAGPGVAIHSDLSQAHGVGVYLRNPLALHLQDFEPGVGTIDQARAAAFKWADTLAEHLGCNVVSSLERDPAPAAPQFDAETLCEVAATLWEAAMSMRTVAQEGWPDTLAQRLDSIWTSRGTAEIRQQVCGYAAACERDWRALGEDGQEEAAPFDWEFVPRWLAGALERDL